MKKIVEKSMLGRAWMVPTYENEDIATTDNLVNKILTSRGIVGDENVKKFLNPSIKEYMPDPSVLHDMDVGARIIADAIEQNHKIAIYGDYDVDGITSTAIFVKYLQELGADVVWHLPTREGEGYGLNVNAVQEIANQGVKLLVTVDCGISNVNEVEEIKELVLKVKEG